MATLPQLGAALSHLLFRCSLWWNLRDQTAQQRTRRAFGGGYEVRRISHLSGCLQALIFIEDSMLDSTRSAKMQPSTPELILELKLGGTGRSRTYLEGFRSSPQPG